MSQAVSNRRRRPAFVYFVGCEATGLIKIGTAVDPLARFSNLKTGSPTKLELLFTQEGGRARERELHSRYARQRRHGEWFALTPRDIDEIAAEAGILNPYRIEASALDISRMGRAANALDAA